MLLLSARCYVVILICLRLLTLLLCLVCIAFSQSDTERSQVDVYNADAAQSLLHCALRCTICHGDCVQYIENGHAVKLPLEPLEQVLLHGVPNLQLSIELQDMVAIHEMSSYSTVIVDDGVDDSTSSAADRQTTEQLFDEWVTSIINFCKQYVLKNTQI
jgi:hypothetical protein